MEEGVVMSGGGRGYEWRRVWSGVAVGRKGSGEEGKGLQTALS